MCLCINKGTSGCHWSAVWVWQRGEPVGVVLRRLPRHHQLPLQRHHLRLTGLQLRLQPQHLEGGGRAEERVWADVWQEQSSAAAAN